MNIVTLVVPAAFLLLPSRARARDPNTAPADGTTSDNGQQGVSQTQAATASGVGRQQTSDTTEAGNINHGGVHVAAPGPGNGGSFPPPASAVAPAASNAAD